MIITETVKKNVLITGASSGIGRQFAKIFGEKGYNLILAARNYEKMAEIKNELSENISIEIISIDLSEKDSAEKLYSILKDKGIAVDILINNAGYGLEGMASELDIGQQTNMIDLNVITMTKLAIIFSKDMIEKGYGRILNVGSVASFFPVPLMSVYSATKAYVFSFSQSLNTELSKKGDISVTALCPGPVRTNFCKTAGVNRLRKFFESLFKNPDEVALVGYKKLMSKKIIAVPGTAIKLMIILSKFAPFKLINKILEYISK